MSWSGSERGLETKEGEGKQGKTEGEKIWKRSETRCTNGEGQRSLSTERGDLGTDGGRGRERLGKREPQDKKCNRSPECQGDTEQSGGEWRSSTTLHSYEHEDLLTD